MTIEPCEVCGGTYFWRETRYGVRVQVNTRLDFCGNCEPPADPNRVMWVDGRKPPAPDFAPRRRMTGKSVATAAPEVSPVRAAGLSDEGVPENTPEQGETKFENKGEHIPPEVSPVVAAGSNGQAENRTCEVCGASLAGKRRHAKTCGAICRRRKMYRERRERKA